MRICTLKRKPSTDEGTFGTFTTDNGKSWDSLELPDRSNAEGVSCIPKGTYTCDWINSPKHGECYQVMDVPSRTMIEQHSANFAGNKDKGYDSQLLGCIALGKSVAKLKNSSGNMQTAVCASKVAIAELEAEMNKESYTLVIS